MCSRLHEWINSTFVIGVCSFMWLFLKKNYKERRNFRYHFCSSSFQEMVTPNTTITPIQVAQLACILCIELFCHSSTKHTTVPCSLYSIIMSGDSSVVRAPKSWSKGRGFEFLQERRENFLLQGRLSVLTLTSVSVPPLCYHSST